MPQPDSKSRRGETAEKAFFLNAVSHDLRTSLNGLVLQANLGKMTAKGADPEALNRAFSEIKGSAPMASRLLDRLLEYARCVRY